MFNIGFSMEELMFPENYQSSCLIDKLDDLSPIDNYQEEDDDDDNDDWFTIKQLNQDSTLNDDNIRLINDQTLPLLNVFSDSGYISQVKSMIEHDGSFTAVLLPNLSIKLTHDKNNPISSESYDQQLLTTTTTQQQSNRYMMSKSTSSLSFHTQSSTSMTSNSFDEMSLNSNDLNEVAIINHSTESIQKLSHHLKKNDLTNIRNRRRRKRTIFSLADIEHLKEAFIQNPKPSQQDIAVLSEQLGHDSYVIRVWFYNKRQATKKTKYLR